MTEVKRIEGEGKAPVTRKKFEEEIILKAWKDPEYKKRLLESPKEVLQEELQKIRPELKLPDNFHVFVHEETTSAVHITLPVNPGEFGDVSGEEWLENAAGGALFVGAVVVGQAAVVAVVVGGVLV